MYTSSKVVKQKLKAEVELTLNDGRALVGNFFLNSQERVLDVLNDDRSFLPFLHNDGGFTVVNKVAISSIRPAKQDVEHVDEVPRRLGY